MKIANNQFRNSRKFSVHRFPVSDFIEFRFNLKKKFAFLVLSFELFFLP